MEKIVIRTACLKTVMLTFVSLAFVAAGIFILSADQTSPPSSRDVSGRVAIDACVIKDSPPAASDLAGLAN